MTEPIKPKCLPWWRVATQRRARYSVSPSCLLNVCLSQKSHSSTMTPSCHRPMVAISRRKALLVGGTLPLAVGIGSVKVRSITPVTVVQSPEAILIGCSAMRVSGRPLPHFLMAVASSWTLVRAPVAQVAKKSSVVPGTTAWSPG